MRDIGILLLGMALLCGCDPRRPVGDDPRLVDIDGLAHGTLARPARGRWNTLFFVGTDCPVSNRYAPEIRRICAQYEPAGAQCLLVYADAQVPIAALRTHRAQFGLDLPAVQDSGRVLVARAAATTTPQAAVFDAHGTLVYSGRIDDFHTTLGSTRQAATEHDLRNALDDVIAGRPVRKPRADPLGCYIE